MPIRPESDTLSNASAQKYNYMKKQDPTASNISFNRFIYMTPGNKDKFYDWRLDFSKMEIDYQKFVINVERYVNRPDNIAFDAYGNAKYWWIIAMANDILDPFTGFYKGRELKIPEINMFKKKLGL